MADEWREVAIEDISDDITVGHVGLMASEYVETGVPFLRSLNIEPFRVNEANIRYITPEFHARLRKSTLRPGDVVIVRTGKPGATAIIPEWLKEANCSDLVIVRPGKELNRHFLLYFMNSVAQQHVSAHLVGAVQQHFNVGSARQIKIKLPPFNEQQAIACILGALDDKIELNRRMNRTLEGLARAIFQSWFVDFDPVRWNMQRQGAKTSGRKANKPKTPLASSRPGESALTPELAALFPNAFENSELGEIPQGWKASSLPEVFQVNPTRSLSKGVLAPYLDMSNMPTQGPSPESWVMRQTGSGMKFVNGDTLVARITPCLENGKTAFVDFLADGEVGWGSTEYIVLRPKGAIPPIFAYLLARTEDFRTFAIQQMTGSSGWQRVPADSLDKYRVPTPEIDLPIFRHFGELVAPMFDRIKAAMGQSRALAALRDALLPKLISGELRVPDAERIVGRCI
jgi:type I restriction enzyme, S subunit